MSELARNHPTRVWGRGCAPSSASTCSLNGSSVPSVAGAPWPSLTWASAEQSQMNLNSSRKSQPVLMTVDEVATLLRTTRAAVYAMVERRKVTGVVRLGRRVLFRSDDLLDWLDQNRVPSLKE